MPSSAKPRFRATGVVLALLCVMYFINYVVRVNVSTAAAVFQKELGLSNTQLGLIFSMFAYPYLLFQFIGGWVSDRWGARRALTGFAVLWSTATILMGLTSTLGGMLVSRVLLGIGVSALPTATRAMADWTPAGGGVSHKALRIPRRVSATRSRRRWLRG